MTGLFIQWPEKPECCIYCPCYDKHCNCNASRRALTTSEVFVAAPSWCRARFISTDKERRNEGHHD